MINILISSTILILLISLIRKLFIGKISRTMQYFLWIFVALRLLIPAQLFENVYNFEALIVPRAVRNEATGTEKETSDVINHGGIPAISQEPLTYADEGTAEGIGVLEILRFIWVTGILIISVVILISNWTFQEKLKKNREYIAEYGGLRVYRTQTVDTPCLYGFPTPGIYLTGDCMEDGRRQMAFEHELAHYQHKDHIWAMIRTICVCIYWFDPFVWLAASMSARDGELACDEAVLKKIGGGRKIEYGQMILDLSAGSRFDAMMHCSTGMSSDRREMEERIRMISLGSKPMKIASLAVMAVVILCMMVAFGSRAADGVDNGNGVSEVMVEDDILAGNMQVWEFHQEEMYDYWSFAPGEEVYDKIPRIDLNLDGVAENIFITKLKEDYVDSNGEKHNSYKLHIGEHMMVYGTSGTKRLDLQKIVAFAVDEENIFLGIVYDSNGQNTDILYYDTGRLGSVTLFDCDITQTGYGEYVERVKELRQGDN